MAAAVAMVLIGIAAWRASDMVLGPDTPPTLREQRVLGASPGRIRLSRDRESLEAGVWALEWPDGFGRVGRVLEADDDGVLRVFHSQVGDPPVGGWASLRGVSRSADPRTMLGLEFDDVTIDGPLGRYPAWFVPGHDSTWVVYVHGRATDRPECLRTLSVLSARGLPGLLVTYRGDLGAPRSRDGHYHLGLDEWRDLEASVRWALAHGARDVVLSGYSMGGHIVMQFMLRSSLAGHVRAVVLESPVLDWNATFETRAKVIGVPAFIAWLGVRVACVRAGLDWRQLDLVSEEVTPAAPVLIFHCRPDRFAPFVKSAAYARALPGRVTLVPVPGGNHVEAWNHDPGTYAQELNGWLDSQGIAPTRGGAKGIG